MMHEIPREYRHDAKMVTLYNSGFKEGYYGLDIIDTRQVMSDYERLAYANDRRAGELKRKEASE